MLYNLLPDRPVHMDVISTLESVKPLCSYCKKIMLCVHKYPPLFIAMYTLIQLSRVNEFVKVPNDN